MIRRRAERLLRHELIGLECRVLRASNPALLGLKGRIVDETRNMITVIGRGGEKRIPKRETTLQLILPEGETVEVEGKRLVKRPEDRIKRR
jgi:ribonuclease P protein subunit POP4